MKTDTHAKRIVAAISEDERQRLGTLMQRRDDALRAAAAGLAEMVAFKDRTISEVRGRLAASRARLCGEPKRTRERKKAARRAMGKLVSGTEVSNREHRVDRNGK